MKIYILRGEVEEVEETEEKQITSDFSELAKQKMDLMDLSEFFSNPSPHMAEMATKYVRSLELLKIYPLSLKRSYFNTGLEQLAFWSNPTFSNIHRNMFFKKRGLLSSKLVFYAGNPALIDIILPIIITRSIWPPIFSSNPDGFSIIEDEIRGNPESKKICWKHLMENPNAIPMIEDILHRNIDLYKSNGSNIYWDRLCKNKSAIKLVQIAIYEKNIHLDMNEFTKLNDKRIYDIFIEYTRLNRISTYEYSRLLCNIQNVRAIDEIKKLLYSNIKLVNWKSLSGNSFANELLNEHKNLINWVSYSRNPSIIVSTEVTVKRIVVPDIKKEIVDAGVKKQLSDSKKQLSDSKKQLSDSKKKLSDSKKKLSDSKKKLSDLQIKGGIKKSKYKRKECLIKNTRRRYN